MTVDRLIMLFRVGEMMQVHFICLLTNFKFANLFSLTDSQLETKVIINTVNDTERLLRSMQAR